MTLDSIKSAILSRILKQNLSISLYCSDTQKLIFIPNLVFLTKFNLFKKYFIGHPSTKILKLRNRFFDFHAFCLGINFVPNKKTLVVAKLGLKLLETSCYLVGIT